MLRFKDYILPNLGVFFRYKNTVDIFVEDNYDEEFYKVIVNRVFQTTGHRINKLIALGSKENVINACISDQTSREIPRLYIVDGDLELIDDSNNGALKHLFILEKYCIENYLIQEDSIVEILHDFLLIEKKKIQAQLSFQNWLKGISKSLIELFLHYSICKKICPTQPTVSLGVGNLCESIKKIPVLNNPKCNQRIDDLRNIILQAITEEEYNDIIYDLRAKWPYNVETLLTIVSGKDYLLPLLEFRFYKFKGTKSINMRRDSLRIRLAKLIDVSDLKKMTMKIK